MLRRWCFQNSGLLAIASFVLGLPVSAQSPLPACEPPAPDEFLLLVRLEAEGDRDKLRLTLPPETAWTACRYQEGTVARIGGFRSLETANNWGQYTVEIAGLPAFVARSSRPANTATNLDTSPRQLPPPTPPPRAQPSAPRPQTPPVAPATPPPAAPTTIPDRYTPRPLGAGYAVLIDYFQQPELARTVQQAVGAEIGLAAHFTRPYLLAAHTSDATAAQALLLELSDRGFSALLVNSNQVMLLTPRVQLP
ncbi:MAG: hypothetical protein HC910_05850 [Spirulinaceae cyanobacterium SM2_1_0]|nr:hypothetical protein [Spirulinaceae cyanobacterium SM2_1_0]